MCEWNVHSLSTNPLIVGAAGQESWDDKTWKLDVQCDDTYKHSWILDFKRLQSLRNVSENDTKFHQSFLNCCYLFPCDVKPFKVSAEQDVYCL